MRKFSYTVAGSGRFVPNKPTLTYLTSGKFTITNYDSSFTYTASNGTIASGVITIPTATGSSTLAARSSKGLSNSTPATIFRQVAVQSSYFTATGPAQCLYSSGPIGGFCGPGTYYAAGAWGPGEPAGFYCCGTPGYTTFYYVDYAPSGYTWSGANYTNGAGEWYKIQ
jgi:hypothetical protein